MKPEQLNRLIRTNGRMQPWFLRNTSELYDSAVRSYYGRGPSTMPYSSQIGQSGSVRVAENESPLRKLTKAEQKLADEYPRTHRLQTARIASGQRLPTVMQASHQRSMSRPCGGAHPYSVFGGLKMGGDSSSISCSSASSEPSQHRLVMDNLPRCLRKSRAAARRERKRTERRVNRAINLGNGHQLDLDMGLFNARSLSVPPPSGLGMGNTTISSLIMRQMPPCRKHHMKAIEKTTLANAVALMPRGEGDALMTVDATLKRQISVIEKGQRTSPELGPHLSTGGGSGNGNGSLIHNPPNMRFRFHGLGDRTKQFEYIQFADGPVTSYAFDRRQHRGASNTTNVSTYNSIENSTNRGQKKQPAQLRVPSVHNVLHANHRQRSRSLEPPRAELLMPQALPQALPLPLPTMETTRSTRGSSLEIRSRTALTARGAPVRKKSGLAKPTFTATNSKAKMSSKLSVKGVETAEGMSLRAETPRFRANWQMTSRTAKASLLAKKPYENDTKEFRGSTDIRKSNLNSGAFKDINGTSKDTNSRSFSTAKLQFRRSSVDGSFKGDSGAALSAAFAKEFSSYPAHNEPARATCAPVRRVQLQQRSVEMDSSNEDLALCLMTVKRKVKPKIKTLLEMPMANKMSTSQVRRSSHRSFYQSGNQEDMSPRHKTQHKQQELMERAEKETEQREQNLDRLKWSHGTRAITVPSSQPEKPKSKLSGTGQLLAKRASQVMAYKRAFRTTHPMLKAEILHRQAQNLIKLKPKSTPNWSSESSSHSNQQTIQPDDVRPIQQSRLQSRQGPIPATSRTTIRPGRNGAFATEDGTSGKGGANGTNGFTVKAVAAPVTATLTAAGTRTIAASTTTSTVKPAFMQKAQLTQRKPSTKGAVSGAVTATAAEGEGGGGGGGQARSGGGRKAAGGATKQRQTTPTLTVQQQQQQHSRYDSGNGNSLIGFRREAANRSASTQLQRRDESEQQQHRPHQRQHQQPQQSQRRQYQFQIPPWRPSY